MSIASLLTMLACGLAIAGLLIAGKSVGREKSIKRSRYAIVGAVIVAIAVGIGGVAVTITVDVQNTAAAQVGEVLESWGFVGSNGFHLDNAGLYQFDTDRATSGKINVVGRNGQPMQLSFVIGSGTIWIGCRRGTDFSRAGPFTAKVFRTIGRCPM